MEIHEIITIIASTIAAISGIAVNTSRFRNWFVFTAYRDMSKDKILKNDYVREGFSFNKEVSDTLKSVQLSILRVEILQNIHNTPDKVNVIITLYEEYKKAGGNHYIDEVYAEWFEKYAKKVINKRITKGEK